MYYYLLYVFVDSVSLHVFLFLSFLFLFPCRCTIHMYIDIWETITAFLMTLMAYNNI